MDIHEKPFEKTKKAEKRCFCTAGICKCTVVLKLEIYNLEMFIRPSDIKCSFACSYFVLFRIIRIAEVYSEPRRTSTMELFGKIVKDFQLLNILIKISILHIRLGFECVSENQVF